MRHRPERQQAPGIHRLTLSHRQNDYLSLWPYRSTLGPMLTLSFILARQEMRRHLTGALAGDPVLPSPEPREQRPRQPVDRRRPAQRRPHMPLVAPQAARSDKDLL